MTLPLLQFQPVPLPGSRSATRLTEQPSHRLPKPSPGDIQATVLRARRAAEGFRASTPHQRRALLSALAALILRDAEVLAQTISAEMGKTITEARGEVRRAQNTLLLSGDAATFLDGEVLNCAIVSGGVDRQAVVTYAPVGVVAAITPFNYPVNLLCHKLGPAIAAGNAVVVKPSPKAPLAADHLVRLTVEAGFPHDLVQIVHGGAEAALALARAPIDLLSFTGGPQAGLALKRASGLVRCLMELGGNDPLFVLPDADLEAASNTAIGHRFEIAGQSCAAVKKLYVHEACGGSFHRDFGRQGRRPSLWRPLRGGDPDGAGDRPASRSRNCRPHRRGPRCGRATGAGRHARWHDDRADIADRCGRPTPGFSRRKPLARCWRCAALPTLMRR